LPRKPSLGGRKRKERSRATDLKEQRIGVGMEPIHRASRRRGSRWPYVATPIVLIVLTGVGLLLLREEAPQPSTSAKQRVATIEGMATDTPEGGGFTPPAEPVRIDVDAGSYVKGAFTSIREASADGPPPRASLT
jgi:hypothetical protein